MYESVENKTQIGEETINSILAKLTDMVKSQKVISPEEWIDAAGSLQILRFAEEEKRLAFEIIANKKKQEIRKSVESNADADLEWKTTTEYENWRRQEEFLKNILEFGRIAKKEAEIRNQNGF